MKTQRVCFSCGRKIEGSPGEPPCRVLKGWLTISHWKGAGSVEHYNFCSFGCLKSWADVQVPRVPEIFLKSFEGDKGDKN